MAISYTQTDDSVSCVANSYCSGISVDTLAGESEAVDGGTAGSGTFDITNINDAADRVGGGFSIVPDSGVSWDAGTWTVRFNVTTENMFLTVTEIYICRVNSSCTNQETIGSATGLSISLSSAGVKSQTVSGSAVTPSAGDRVTICLVVNNSNMNRQTATITKDQDIDSPFTAVVDESVFPTFGPFGQTGPRFDPTEIVGY